MSIYKLCCVWEPLCQQLYNCAVRSEFTFGSHICLASCMFAVKILEKRHIIREKKVQYVSREKEVMLMLEHPFFIQLYFTFQDKDSLCIQSPF